MQIHELNDFTGTLGANSYVPVDNGTDTGKVSTQQILAATEARIDNIIAGPAPSAEEIVDARLGADGVVYPSLGDAIRDQVSDVKSDISEKERTYLGMLTMGYWKQSNLNEYANSSSCFITADVSGGETYYISGTCVNSAFPLVIMVDSGNTVLGTIYTSDGVAVNDYELKVPSNCTKVYVNGRLFGVGSGANYPSIYKYLYSAKTMPKLLFYP